MDRETIIKALDLHGVPHYEEGGRVYADSMRADLDLFQEVEDVTDWSRSKLSAWLGY